MCHWALLKRQLATRIPGKHLSVYNIQIVKTKSVGIAQ